MFVTEMYVNLLDLSDIFAFIVKQWIILNIIVPNHYLNEVLPIVGCFSMTKYVNCISSFVSTRYSKSVYNRNHFC